MSNGSRKGSAFEREMARQFSLWWTNGKEDDVFWRTPMSGGRSTVRIKKGQSAIQVGDLQAIDERGRVFTELVEVELKTGYPGQSPLQLLGKSFHTCQWYRWIVRLIRTRARPYWLLVHRIHQGQILVAIRKALLEDLCPSCEIMPSIFDVGRDAPVRIVVVSWAWFVRTISPEAFKDLYQEKRR